ncbi:hypothetical protein GQ600_6041 [Phytophthora cactorum]|nr:hypothetical protein GQ600_6041 [Phytophthora cactorum]
MPSQLELQEAVISCVGTSEWRVIVGMAKGSIACRRTPAFLKDVLDSASGRRVNSPLGSTRGIRVSPQSTRAITETILESAELARVNLPALQRCLDKPNDQLRPSDEVNSFLLLYEATTAAHQEVVVPFKVEVRVQNAHRPSEARLHRQFVFRRQSASERAEYTVVIYNLTRFNEI